MAGNDAANDRTPSLIGPGQVLGEKVKVPLLSLRLDECTLRGGALDVLGDFSISAC
jgi:hypothetical protein